MSHLDDVTFDTTGFEAREDSDTRRIWWTPDGDGLGLFHFAQPPDIGADPGDVAALRAFYRRLADGAGLGVLEIERVTVDRCVAVRTLFKARQDPTGRTYLGSLTLPFRDFSFSLKVQCEERGTTGLRDSVVFDVLKKQGAVRQDGDRMLGWASDPYDAALQGPMTRNRSEAEEYDASFATHPLSRARTILRHLEATTRISDRVRNSLPFRFPAE